MAKPPKSLIPFKMRISGEREIVRKFKSLERVGARRVLRKSVRAGAAPQVKETKRNAPTETRFLKKQVGQKVKAYRRGQYVLAVIGAKSKKDPQTGRNPANYVHLVESGTKQHAIGGPKTTFRRVRGARGRFARGQAVVTNSKILRFTASDSRVHYRHRVVHPGAKPSRFMERSYRAKRQESLRQFQAKFATEVIAEARRA